MRFLVLGPLEGAKAGREPLPIAGSKERTILACLIARAGRVVPVDDLIEELWGDHPPRAPGVAARLPDVSIRPRTAGHGDAGADRRSADHHLGDRSAVRCYRARLLSAGHRDDPGILLGVVARHLPDGQRIQAVSDHRWTTCRGHGV